MRINRDAIEETPVRSVNPALHPACCRLSSFHGLTRLFWELSVYALEKQQATLSPTARSLSSAAIQFTQLSSLIWVQKPLLPGWRPPFVISAPHSPSWTFPSTQSKADWESQATVAPHPHPQQTFPSITRSRGETQLKHSMTFI